MNEGLSELDLIGLLDRLSPVPEPAPISLWPETEAWIFVGLALVAVAIFLGRRAIARWRANAYRRAALREIAAVGSSPATLSEILRRSALVAFPRSDVAGLYGDEWLAFLDRSGGSGQAGGSRSFQEGPGSVLARAPYDAHYEWEAEDGPNIRALCVRWVSRHRADSEGSS
jgi:hypothetical protein